MKTQALGWLAAGVLAAGLNASYHNGGLEWAHRIVNQVSHDSNAVLALATGNANRFYNEARVARSGEERSPCRLSWAMAQVQSAIPNADVVLAQFDRMSERQKTQLARFEARRAQMETQFTHIEIPALHIQPMMVKVSDMRVCPRVRVNMPRIPDVKVPAIREIHIELPSAGPA